MSREFSIDLHETAVTDPQDGVRNTTSGHTWKPGRSLSGRRTAATVPRTKDGQVVRLQRIKEVADKFVRVRLAELESVDLRLFVTAVNIHREVGGNLADTLERLSNTIRDRLRIKRQVRVYSAQGRLSGYILVALPIVMAIMLYIIAPGYLEEFVKVQEGKYAIGIAVIAQIVGFLIIKRLIHIRI